MNKATLFIDLDGTLLNVFKRLHRLHLFCCKLSELDALPYKKYITLKRQKVPESQILGVSQKKFKKYNDLRLQHIEDWDFLKSDTLSAGSLNFLRYHKERNKLVLITARKNKANLLKQLNFLKVKLFFKDILISGDRFRSIQNYLHFQPSSSILIGDTEDDIDIAKKLNILPIIVSYGMRTSIFLKKYHPPILIKNLSEVKKLSLGIGSK